MPLLSRPLMLALASLGATPLILLADSMSPYNVQRRLENYTNQIIDSCRAGANDNNRPRYSSPNVWNQNVKTPQQVRAEAEENSRQWALRREQEARMARDSQRAAIERAENDRIRMEQYVQQEQARLQQLDWDAFRKRVGGYASRTPRPPFKNPALAVEWLVRHTEQAPNQWAQVTASLLLIDGIGVPRDLSLAEKLLEPGAVPAGEALHVNKRILLAYLRALQSQGGTPAAQQPRAGAALAELRTLATTEPIAKWFLARLLSSSSSSGERLESLRLFPGGHDQALSTFTVITDSGDRNCTEFVHRTARDLLDRCISELPAAIGQWGAWELTQMAGQVHALSLANRNQILDTYAEAVACRCVGLAPERPLSLGRLGRLLDEAARARSPAACGLADLERFHLLNMTEPDPDKSGWRGCDRLPAGLEALERWAAGTDTLAARARHALGLMGEEAESGDTLWHPPQLPECLAWQATGDETIRRRDEDWNKGLAQASRETQAAVAAEQAARKAALEAVARRDAQSPSVEATKIALRKIRGRSAFYTQYAFVRAFDAAGDKSEDPGFRVEHGGFDLARAEALYAQACLADTLLIERKTLLIEAARLGDAFAPAALGLLLDSPQLNERFRALSVARQARDEKTGSVRVAVARLLHARQARADTTALLERAVALGSPLARRLQLEKRLSSQMSGMAGSPPSWELPAALVAELDQAVREANSDGRAVAELMLMHSFASEAEREAATSWFDSSRRWEQDLREREKDSATAESLSPAVNGLVETLALWPGINHSDTRHQAMLAEARKVRHKADALLATDAPAGLALLVQAAAKGERGSLSRIARHLRLGTGALPRAPQFAELLEAVELRMLEADANSGDAEAALELARAFEEGRGTRKDLAATQRWLQTAAELGNSFAASRLSGEEGGEKPPLPQRLRAMALWRAIHKGEHLPTPPRNPPADTRSLAPVRARLEALLAQAAARAKAPDVRFLEVLLDPNRLGNDEEWQAALPKDPVQGLLALAEKARTDTEIFHVATLLAGGQYGLDRDPVLAKGFHQVGLALLKLRAERGDADTACRLGLYALATGDAHEAASGIEWLSHAAQRGLLEAAQLLTQITREGLPGVSASPAASTRWHSIEVELQDGSHLVAPPLVLPSRNTPLATFRPKLLDALAAAKATLQAAKLENAAEWAARRTAARDDEDRQASLLALAALTAAGDSEAGFLVASVLSSGDGWLEPDMPLALQYRQAALALREAEGERGNAEAACRVGRLKLHNRNAPPDIPSALQWLTYAGELGSAAAVEELAQLYTVGANGLPPDPLKAAYWAEQVDQVRGPHFTPRKPLR